jgi:beta-galactosidase GanA
MRNRFLLLAFFSAASLFPTISLGQSTAEISDIPHLEKRGAATQLIVDGKPYLMLGVELHNSSSSSLKYMEAEWPHLAALGLNTVLTPVSWELVEPAEGKYDFVLVDGLLTAARQQHLHLVLLWLAAWKNGMSSYPPVWVKQDTKRFPRAVQDGREVNILSTFGGDTQTADARAFAALMQHLRDVDAHDHTVLMVQVENEVGVLGSTRDHSAAANRAYAGAVPAELLRHLEQQRAELNPDLRALWEEHGAKTTGTWAEIFGDTPRADEIFMAWQYAKYVQAVAAKGKAAYGLPLYVNTWLGGDDAIPGNYPSGGPQPRVMDVWKAAGSAIDLYAPDLYASDVYGWARRYHRPDNPLFLPETNGGTVGAANVFYILGEHAALGFSPFGVDNWSETTANQSKREEGEEALQASYEAIASVAPMLLDAQTKGEAHGFVLDKSRPAAVFVMQGYAVEVSLDEIFGSHAESGYGLILATGPDAFLGVGKGFRVKFTPRDPAAPMVSIGTIDEGRYENGSWVPGRRLNGDENDQGEYWRFDPRQLHTERLTLYHHQ